MVAARVGAIADAAVRSSIPHTALTDTVGATHTVRAAVTRTAPLVASFPGPNLTLESGKSWANVVASTHFVLVASTVAAASFGAVFFTAINTSPAFVTRAVASRSALSVVAALIGAGHHTAASAGEARGTLASSVSLASSLRGTVLRAAQLVAAVSSPALANKRSLVYRHLVARASAGEHVALTVGNKPNAAVAPLVTGVAVASTINTATLGIAFIGASFVLACKTSPASLTQAGTILAFTAVQAIARATLLITGGPGPSGEALGLTSFQKSVHYVASVTPSPGPPLLA